jgi:hypothetical protein
MDRSNLHRAIAPAGIRMLNMINCAMQKLISFAFSYRSSAYYRGGSGTAELVRREGSE